MSTVDMLELTINSADPGHPSPAHDVHATVLLGWERRMVKVTGYIP